MTGCGDLRAQKPKTKRTGKRQEKDRKNTGKAIGSFLFVFVFLVRVRCNADRAC